MFIFVCICLYVILPHDKVRCATMFSVMAEFSTFIFINVCINSKYT